MVYGGSAGHGGPPASQNSPSGDPGGPHTWPLGPSGGDFDWPAAHHGRRTHHTPYIILYIILFGVFFDIYWSKNGSQKVLKPKKQIVEIEATYVISTADSFFYSFFHIFAKKHAFICCWKNTYFDEKDFIM